MGFGLLTFVITVFNQLVWARLFPRQFADERWTVGREILLTNVNILLIAIANRLYLEWLEQREETGSLIGWVSMILATFLLAIFPTAGAVLFSYIRQLKKYSQSAAQFVQPLPAPHPLANATEQSSDEPVNPSILLLADNEKDALTLNAADLFYIESSDNYCTVVYQQGAKISKPLLPQQPEPTGRARLISRALCAATGLTSSI